MFVIYLSGLYKEMDPIACADQKQKQPYDAVHSLPVYIRGQVRDGLMPEEGRIPTQEENYDVASSKPVYNNM